MCQTALFKENGNYMYYLLNYSAFFPHILLKKLILLALRAAIVVPNVTKGLIISTEIRGIFFEAKVEFFIGPCCMGQIRASNC
jgi:hypothetical protein